MTRSRSLATAAAAAFCLAGGGVPIIIPLYSAQNGLHEDTTGTDDATNCHRTFIDTTPKNTKKSMLVALMGVDAFSPSAIPTNNARLRHPSQTLTKRRRSMHRLSYRPDQVPQTDQAGPMLWQYIFFANWDETFVRVLKSPQESTYVSPNGWTPLHLLMTSSGSSPPLKVVKAVYAAFPQALRMPTNDYRRTPLDLAKRTDQPKEIIEFLENPPKLGGDDDDYYVQPRAVMADDLDDGVCIDIDEDGACIVVEDDDDDNDYINGDGGINRPAQDDVVGPSFVSEENGPKPQSKAQSQASPPRPSPPNKVSVDSTINQQVEEQRRYQEQLRRKLEQRQLEEQMEYEQYQERYYSSQTIMMEEERRRQQLLMEQQQEEAMQRQRRQYIEQQKQQQQGFAPRQPFHSATAANTANGSSPNAAESVNGRRQGSAPASMPNAAATAQQQANQAAAMKQMMVPLQDRIEELTAMHDALTRTKELDAAKIESLERELKSQRDMERQMRSAHYAEISEAHEAAEERLVEYKEEIQRLKEQLEGKREGGKNENEENPKNDEESVEGEVKVNANLKIQDSKRSNGEEDGSGINVDDVKDLRTQIKLLTEELKGKNE